MVIEKVNEEISRKHGCRTFSKAEEYPNEESRKRRQDSKPACPLCGSREVVFNGSVKGRRRYCCKNCRMSFGRALWKSIAASSAIQKEFKGDRVKQVDKICFI